MPSRTADTSADELKDVSQTGIGEPHARGEARGDDEPCPIATVAKRPPESADRGTSARAPDDEPASRAQCGPSSRRTQSRQPAKTCCHTRRATDARPRAAAMSSADRLSGRADANLREPTRSARARTAKSCAAERSSAIATPRRRTAPSRPEHDPGDAADDDRVRASIASRRCSGREGPRARQSRADPWMIGSEHRRHGGVRECR